MIQRKDRWWRSRAEPDPRGDWYSLTTNIFPFESAWGRLKDRSIGTDSTLANVGELDRYEYCIVDQLEGCPVCRRWDMSKVQEPVDMLLQPTNKMTKGFSPYFYQNAWITNVYGLPMSIIHRRLLDVIGGYFDDGILLGDVIVSGGDQIHDLVSVIDIKAPQSRKKYRKSWFAHPGSANYYPCIECGRFRYRGEAWAEYIYSPEHESRAPRFYQGTLLLSPEIMAKADLLDKQSWPKLQCRKVKEYSVLLDPFPSPMPLWWSELEQFFEGKGARYPMHKVLLRDCNSGRWIDERIEKQGRAACVVDPESGLGYMDPDTLATMVYYLRVRALFEPKVAQRIDHWDDKQLEHFLIEYHESCKMLGPYFPV